MFPVSYQSPLCRGRKLITQGYGDRSQTRTASANAHRRSAHGELIVAPASRIEDSVSVDEHIRRSGRAHGDENTIVVMNRIDVR